MEASWRNDNGKAPIMSQQAQAMEARQKLRQTVMQSVLLALDSPQSASNTAGPPAPAPPAPPVPPPVNRGLFPAQQAPPPMYPTPPPARTPPAVHPAPTPSPHYVFAPQSQGTGPIMLNFQAGGPPIGMSSGAAATGFGAPAIAQTGAYGGNAASSSLIHDQSSLNPAGADDQNELSAMMAMYTNPNPNPPMAPQHFGDGPNEAAIPTLYNTNYTNNYNAAGSLAAAPQHVGAHDAAAFAALEAELNSDDDDFGYLGTGSDMEMAPDQVLGMESFMNELTTMAGDGAFGGGNGNGNNDVAASSAATNGGGAHVAPPGVAMLDADDMFESLMEPFDPVVPMDANATSETMTPDTGDNFTFPLGYLMDLLDDGENEDGASARGGANTAAVDDVAGTSQNGGTFMFPYCDDDMNNGREY